LGWSSRCLAAPRTTRPHDHPPVPPFRLGKVGDPVEVLAHRVRVAGVVNASCIVPPSVSLTSIDQPRHEMGILAARFLLERIESERTEPRREVLKPKLIPR
jgi:Periplasmic binding protein-like domain